MNRMETCPGPFIPKSNEREVHHILHEKHKKIKEQFFMLREVNRCLVLIFQYSHNNKCSNICGVFFTLQFKQN